MLESVHYKQRIQFTKKKREFANVSLENMVVKCSNKKMSVKCCVMRLVCCFCVCVLECKMIDFQQKVHAHYD